MNVSKEKLVFALEWFLFIGLTTASAWFASGVLKQYISKRSSFSQHKEEIKKYPVIVIQLMNEEEAISSNEVSIYYR